MRETGQGERHFSLSLCFLGFIFHCLLVSQDSRTPLPLLSHTLSSPSLPTLSSLWPSPLMATALNLLDHYRCKLYWSAEKENFEDGLNIWRWGSFWGDRGWERDVISTWGRELHFITRLDTHTDSFKESQHVCELFTLPFIVWLYKHSTSIELSPLTSGNQWQQFFQSFHPYAVTALLFSCVNAFFS